MALFLLPRGCKRAKEDCFFINLAFMAYLLCAATFVFFCPAAQAQISADHWNGGAVRLGPSVTTCDGNVEGSIRWSSADKTVEMCNGIEWRKVIAASGTGAPAVPDPNIGYFVLSATTSTGNLGGMGGADSKCLSELTDNPWMGKSDAVARGLLVASKVRAWLCNGATCNNLNVLQTYQFAVAGDAAKGGAVMTADSSGMGPGNTQNWSGSNYFGAANYWTGRSAGTATIWAANGSDNCYGWAQSSGYNGLWGTSSSSTATRWMAGGTGCGAQYKLICIAHP